MIGKSLYTKNIGPYSYLLITIFIFTLNWKYLTKQPRIILILLQVKIVKTLAFIQKIIKNGLILIHLFILSI
jgi:hypothetical protein